MYRIFVAALVALSSTSMAALADSGSVFVSQIAVDTTTGRSTPLMAPSVRELRGQEAALLDNIKSRLWDTGGVEVYQTGSFNTAGVVRGGTENRALVEQHGTNNLVSLTQSGTANVAMISQWGNINSLHGTQSGENNYVSVSQRSTGSNVRFTQTGTGNLLAVVQE